jgi:carboxymethylenebutenolidase
MKTETLNFDTAGGAATAYVARPEGDHDGGRDKAIILIQEWWGLNDHIRDIAGRYAGEGFTAIAPDLYRGKLAKNPEEAGRMMQALAAEDGLDTIKSAREKAKEIYGIKRFGITGYCMGGTFALRAACELDGFKAAVPFYGDIPADDLLEHLKTPVLFISAKQDKWINPEKVAKFEETAREFGLPVESVAYEADHAFFNNTRPEVFNPEATADAWKKAIHFFNLNLS